MFYRGQIESLRGISERALEDYNAAQRLQPDNPRTYAARAAVYLELGDYDSAIDDLDQAIKLRPKDATQYLHRGIAYFGKGDWAHAISDYDEAIKIDPTMFQALNNRCMTKAVLGKDLDNAASDCDAAQV